MSDEHAQEKWEQACAEARADATAGEQELEAMARRIRDRGVEAVQVTPEHELRGGPEILVDGARAHDGVLLLSPGVHTDGDVLDADRAGTWSAGEEWPGGFGPLGVYREAEVPEAVWRWVHNDAGWLKAHDLREPWFAQRGLGAAPAAEARLETLGYAAHMAETRREREHRCADCDGILVLLGHALTTTDGAGGRRDWCPVCAERRRKREAHEEAIAVLLDCFPELLERHTREEIGRRAPRLALIDWRGYC